MTILLLSSVLLLLLARPRPHPPLRSNDASHAPPDASRIIFNIDLGPRVVRTTSLTALAAAMLFARAIDPVSREAFRFTTTVGACMTMSLSLERTRASSRSSRLGRRRLTREISRVSFIHLIHLAR